LPAIRGSSDRLKPARFLSPFPSNVSHATPIASKRVALACAEPSANTHRDNMPRTIKIVRFCDCILPSIIPSLLLCQCGETCTQSHTVRTMLTDGIAPGLPAPEVPVTLE